MIRFVLNVLHRYIAHWNDHHNELVSALLIRSKTLDSPHRQIAEALLVSSMQVMFKILGPDRIADATRPLTFAELKTLKRSDYERLHLLLLQGFVIIIGQINPHLQPGLRSIVDHVAGSSLNWAPFSTLSAASPDPKAVAWSVAQQCVNVCPLLRSAPMLQVSLVTLMLANANLLTAEIRSAVSAV